MSSVVDEDAKGVDKIQCVTFSMGGKVNMLSYIEKI